MKKIFAALLVLSFTFGAFAQKAASPGQELVRALNLAKKGQYKQASLELFQLSLNPRYMDRRLQIRYILGLMLYQMKLYQASAFQFISVVKAGESKYLKQSLEKLSLAADFLGDDTLLNYAISKVEVDDFPRAHRDMLFYRIGEFQMRNSQLPDAVKNFQRVSDNSSFYSRAKYQQGLAYAELKQNDMALAAFDELVNTRRGNGVTDPGRVSGIMGRARVYYQDKKWDEAVENYRQIPRDTKAWHDTIFESSWAMLRSGKFRSTLSNFQSLHSAYYDDYYLPESLLLRSIVYLYICRYDEMDKVLRTYNKIYRPVYKRLLEFLKRETSAVRYYDEIDKAMRAYYKQGDEFDRNKTTIPFLIIRKVNQEGDFQRTYTYIKRLEEELNQIKSLPSQWQNSAIGKYSNRIVNNRLSKAKVKAGRQIRNHLLTMRAEMFDLFEQEGFIRFEMLNSRKEAIKKSVSQKESEVPGNKKKNKVIDEDSSRDYFVQNGYEYYPFRGEYWLDELGNYHYVGTHSCN